MKRKVAALKLKVPGVRLAAAAIRPGPGGTNLQVPVMKTNGRRGSLMAAVMSLPAAVYEKCRDLHNSLDRSVA
jgi:hypothetical protein